ncbi:hypothetical protein [Streptomyces sp. KL116D]|uniref:hypothetical protein n=1 Tax=Streptomyces sp. KL116D TaxID=3045152 RepID=UPI0035583210
MLFTAAEVPVQYVAVPQQREEAPKEEKDDALADTVLDVIVRRRRRRPGGAPGVAAAAGQLPPSLDLAAARPHARAGPRSHPARLRGRGTPRRSAGLADKRRTSSAATRCDRLRRRGRTHADPRWSAVRKPTLLRSIIASFALTARRSGSPVRRARLSAVAAWPAVQPARAVGGVASRLDSEKVQPDDGAEVYVHPDPARGVLPHGAGIASIADFRNRARGATSR